MWDVPNEQLFWSRDTVPSLDSQTEFLSSCLSQFSNQRPMNYLDQIIARYKSRCHIRSHCRFPSSLFIPHPSNHPDENSACCIRMLTIAENGRGGWALQYTWRLSGWRRPVWMDFIHEGVEHLRWASNTLRFFMKGLPLFARSCRVPLCGTTEGHLLCGGPPPLHFWKDLPSAVDLAQHSRVLSFLLKSLFLSWHVSAMDASWHLPF